MISGVIYIIPQKFLPDEEQAFFNSVVHHLRTEGWSMMEAEEETLERLHRLRQGASTNSPPATQ